MRYLSRNTCLLALLAIALQLGLASADEQTLAWKFKPGEKMRYGLTQETQARASIEGREVMKNTSEQLTESTWEVKSVADDGTAQVEMTIDRMRVKIDAPAGVVQLDSANKVPAVGPTEMLEPTMKALVGAKFSMKMSPAGAISDVVVPEQLKKSLGAGAPGEGMSEENMKSMVEQGTVVLPAKPLAIDGTWTETKENNGLKVDETFKYVGPESVDGQSFEKVEISAVLGWDKPPAELGEVKLVNQDLKGTMHFDNAAGRLHDVEITQKTAMDVTAMGRTVRQDLQMKVTNKLLPAAEEASAATSDTAAPAKTEEAATATDSQ